MTLFKRRNILYFYKALSFAIVGFWLVFLAVFAVNILERKIYPLSYKEEIFAASFKYGVAAELIFSVAKNESGFNANAVSDKGAVGIMQITPSTAEYIAKIRGIKEYDLKDAAINLDFGTYYLKYLSGKFYGVKEVAAAYNAGEGTVNKWLKNKEYSKDGKTLNFIPYKETAAYVDKIIFSINKYKKLYGKLLDK